MKTSIKKSIQALFIAGSALLVLPASVNAHSDGKGEHRHEHNGKAGHKEDKHDFKKGPNGGQLVTSIKPAFEVTVDKDRKVRILFVDEENKPVALEKQEITGITGERSNPIQLKFAKGKEKDENVLISDKSLPAGDHVGIILRIKQTPDAKIVNERLTLHLH